MQVHAVDYQRLCGAAHQLDMAHGILQRVEQPRRPKATFPLALILAMFGCKQSPATRRYTALLCKMRIQNDLPCGWFHAVAEPRFRSQRTMTGKVLIFVHSWCVPTAVSAMIRKTACCASDTSVRATGRWTTARDLPSVSEFSVRTQPMAALGCLRTPLGGVPVAEWRERRQHLITYCICKVLLYFRRV